MKNCSKIQLVDVLFLFLLCYFGLAAPAHAYFDIGTGTFLVQMAVAFAASIWLSMKTSLIKIDRGLKPKTKDKVINEVTAEAEPANADVAKEV